MSATQTQSNYIHDLAVLKTKEFKEVKELIFANEIAMPGSELVANAPTLAAICNALDGYQASKLIDVLIAAKAPARSRAYSTKRISQTIGLLDDIKATIDDWNFS